MHFFHKRLESAVNISDRSDGLRSGMQYINIDHLAPDDEEVETPHCSDWAHLVFHLKKGVRACAHTHTHTHAHTHTRMRMHTHAHAHACLRSHSHSLSPKGTLIPKSNPYFGEIYFMLLAIHLAHSTEQKGLLSDTVTELMEWWEVHGLPQQGKYTTKQLRESHLSYPWNTFSIATYDGMNDGCHDFQLILPSNQCEESWHKGLMKLLKGRLRGSMDVVLKDTMPRILLDDTINMPRELCFEPVNVNVRCSPSPLPSTSIALYSHL